MGWAEEEWGAGRQTLGARRRSPRAPIVAAAAGQAAAFALGGEVVPVVRERGQFWCKTSVSCSRTHSVGARSGRGRALIKPRSLPRLHRAVKGESHVLRGGPLAEVWPPALEPGDLCSFMLGEFVIQQNYLEAQSVCHSLLFFCCTVGNEESIIWGGT